MKCEMAVAVSEERLAELSSNRVNTEREDLRHYLVEKTDVCW
jgi:hypothetical protein